jgi:hypothetical protein
MPKDINRLTMEELTPVLVEAIKEQQQQINKQQQQIDELKKMVEKLLNK